MARTIRLAKTLPDMTDAGWECLEQMGGGGQASVYRVSGDKSPDAVLKLLTHTDDPKALERFYREIEAIRSINHRGLVPIIDSSEPTDETHFYVMERLSEFNSLADLMQAKRNPFFQNPVLAINGYIALLEILAHCHEKGILHRDVSHRNILVSNTGDIKLIDFGLCHIGGLDGITSTSEALGTYGYRAPECLGNSTSVPDVRSDLYSAGKVLWAMVTNENATPREEPYFNHLSLENKLPSVPLAGHLHDIFERTIRKRPEDRHHNAQNAINQAISVKERMTLGYSPLGLLAKTRCQYCGSPEGSVSLSQEQNSDLESHLVFVHQLGGMYFICTNCFHVTISIKSMLLKKLGQRSKLT